MNCHACGAPLGATAKFCHKCGAQVGGTQTAGWRVGLPWGVAGAALGALLTVVALRLGAGSREPGAGDAAEATAPSSQLSAPDISQMSPEERATRLYNRVMMLHTQGKADSAEFFLPMALQAYAMLTALDVDARYHIGVLDLTGGSVPPPEPHAPRGFLAGGAAPRPPARRRRWARAERDLPEERGGGAHAP